MKPTTKGYDLYFGAKNPKRYDYSTRYDYSASAGNLMIARRVVLNCQHQSPSYQSHSLSRKDC